MRVAFCPDSGNIIVLHCVFMRVVQHHVKCLLLVEVHYIRQFGQPVLRNKNIAVITSLG